MADAAAGVSVARTRGRNGFWAKTGALVRKDLVIELRARDTLPPMLVFALAVTVVLGFTLPGVARPDQAVRLPIGAVALSDVLAAFMWITVLFAGLIGFARTFEIEREEGALDSLLLAPLDRSGLFVAKAVANLVFIALAEAVAFPLFGLFFDLRLGSGWLAIVAIALLVDIGFACIGTLFSALAAQTRSRELVLPILALPTLIPVFIAALELSSDVIDGRSFSAVREAGWFGLLVAFDVIAGITGALTFEFALD